MSDGPCSSRSQSRASERSPPTRPASTKPKPITAKPQPMGPPPAPSPGGADDLDEFDFMSKIPSPAMSLLPAPRAKSGGTQPKRKKPVFEDFMDLIPASQRVVWPSSGAPVISASSKEPRVSDTMEVDDGGKEARTTIPAAPAEPRSLPKARNKARDVQPRGSGTHVAMPRGRTQSVTIQRSCHRLFHLLVSRIDVATTWYQAQALNVDTRISKLQLGPSPSSARPPCYDNSVPVRALIVKQSVGNVLQNPVSSAGPSAGPPSSGQPTHPMGIVVPPPRNPQDIADLETRSDALKNRLAHLWETLTKVRGEMTHANDDVHKAVLEIEAIAKSLG
ncbi:hypothetical protein EDB85DRAFT_1902454 [Lactarius pseudohatsudake]|nr:hypothetical protein EDB85DRAFT_1902454 [Lactarius pseudohatsudake]